MQTILEHGLSRWHVPMLTQLARALLAATLMASSLCAQSAQPALSGRVRRQDQPVPPVVSVLSATVQADSVQGQLAPLWRDHYDLSVSHLIYLAEPGFLPLAQSVQPRSWRCSVGRWEVSTQPPTGGDSLLPTVLATIDREFYRGPNTLAGADDPASYDFTYLDEQLAHIRSLGAKPFLCFDYMPFTLSAQQSPFNPHNLGVTNPNLSFSNGIRTAPPADPGVYARVVRNTARHVRGLFAGTTDFDVDAIEIGNEPDLIDASGTPLRYFWTGTTQQWLNMYAQIAAEIDGDPLLAGQLELGAGSFAFFPHEPGVSFLEQFLTDVAANGRRLDFVSYHSYGDALTGHLLALVRLTIILDSLGLTTQIVNGEWGRALDGLDPVYDTVEHGLFRTKVMMLMQLFGVTRSHEALFRDLASGSGQLGLVTTGPAGSKPVTDIYRALNLINTAPLALATSAPNGSYVMAGKSADDSRVVVVWVGDDPGTGRQTRLDITVNSLPWGNAPFSIVRYEVSDASWAAGLGVAAADTRAGIPGPAFVGHATLGPGPGAGTLVLWELVRD